MGDHTETLQVDYDPEKITYEELLEVFWDSHSPTRPSFSTQYKAVIFYHNQEQARAARESRDGLERQYQGKIYTEIQPYTNFYLGEDYHQKYYLQNSGDMAAEIMSRYPNFPDFVASTAAARINGYIGGYGDRSSLEADLDGLGLSPAGRDLLKRLVRR